jgi:Chitobiase/beta-hexosaminidase C-terminal domain
MVIKLRRADSRISEEQPPVRPFRKAMKAALTCLLAVALFSNGSHAESAKQVAFGIAWRVSGAWHVNGGGSPLSNGGAIVPGSLLQPSESTHDHSITILLPDGQRVLYECFSAQDCARGFRVPSLYRKPDAIAVDFLGRVNAVSLREAGDSRTTRVRAEQALPRDEVVAALDDENKVEIAGLAAALSNGSYWYQVRPISQGAQEQSRRAFEKSSRSITLTLPSEGLFDVSIVDHLNTPRIDLLVAAVHQPRARSLLKSFHDVQALLTDWNEDYQGWPVHDFQRCFLRSLLLHIPPSIERASGNVSPLNENRKADVTAEPRFSPAPGVFHGDTEVGLQIETAGATIHYTVDGSQPFTESNVYHSPIMVKGTELTIKAFASAKGKKDSPVITGIFRIGD